MICGCYSVKMQHNNSPEKDTLFTLKYTMKLVTLTPSLLKHVCQTKCHDAINDVSFSTYTSIVFPLLCTRRCCRGFRLYLP